MSFIMFGKLPLRDQVDVMIDLMTDEEYYFFSFICKRNDCNCHNSSKSRHPLFSKLFELYGIPVSFECVPCKFKTKERLDAMRHERYCKHWGNPTYLVLKE